MSIIHKFNPSPASYPMFVYYLTNIITLSTRHKHLPISISKLKLPIFHLQLYNCDSIGSNPMKPTPNRFQKLVYGS